MPSYSFDTKGKDTNPKSVTCPNCGASLEVGEGRTSLFCSYCGGEIILDDKNSTTHNYNYTKIVRDESRIRESDRKERIRLKELEYKERQDKRDNKIAIICGLIIPLIILLAIWLGPEVNKWASQSQGKICAGYYEDYIGEKYESVVEQFEEMGFTNIVTVDLKDSGLAFWNNGKVKSITVGGDSEFDSDDYFDPDTKIIISYH